MVPTLNHIIKILIITQIIFQMQIKPTIGGVSTLEYYEVHISNGLGPGQPPVRLRCQSKSDDFGTRILQRGQTMNWGFAVNFWGTTLYFCHFYWKDQQISFDVFRAEDENNLSRRETYWDVREDGFYHRRNHEDWVRKHGWDQ
ncbi:hypothetical protein RND81_09G100900 [Saponaria officinalis]|uniref:S-protein homolog n=1 Tax=Saponaria officinalis TaxID=3572 RepID=A0AAW1IKB4_SAPOF